MVWWIFTLAMIPRLTFESGVHGTTRKRAAHPRRQAKMKDMP